jgi:predicted nucleic-acid-binding Zn-ribbon protein
MTMTDKDEAESAPDRNAIEAAFAKKSVSGTCPRCSNTEWQALDKVVTLRVRDKVDAGISLTGPVVACSTVVCSRCGFVSMHAVGTLFGEAQ